MSRRSATWRCTSSGNGNMGFGDVDVQAGFFTWGGNSTPGDPARTYTVGSSAILNFFAHAVPFNKVLILQNGATVQNGNGTPNIAGPVTLNGTANFNLANPVLVSNVISGPGTLVKLGANNLTLFGTNTYTGNTTISAGPIDAAGECIDRHQSPHQRSHRNGLRCLTRHGRLPLEQQSDVGGRGHCARVRSSCRPIRESSPAATVFSAP